MKVFHFISSSAYNTFFVDVAHHVDRSRTTLWVGSLTPDGELQESMTALGIDSFSLRCTRRAYYPIAIVRLARFLRQQRVDVLHTHLVEASLVGLAAARLARIPVRVMTRHHADAVFLSGSRRGLAVDRLIGRHLANEVIAVSKAAKRALVEIDGVDESKISIVPNGYDWSRIQSHPEAAHAIQHTLGIENVPVLCVVARLDPLKGHDVLLRALTEDAVPPTTRLLIVGEGPQEKLRAMAQQLGVADRCIFLGHRRDVYDIMAASDLIVHPSLSEAQCHVLTEALALARPVVATSVGAADEVIMPGRTGWLVPPHDHAALARTIGEALADPDRARAYALAGQELVRGLYPIHKMLQGYEAVYTRRLSKMNDQ